MNFNRRGLLLMKAHHPILADVSDSFFFWFGAGEKEEASEQVAGGRFFLPKIEGGGYPRRRNRRNPKGDGGKGTGKKKCHDNLRQTSRQFTTCHDNLRHFMTISVSLYSIDIKRHKTS